MGLSKDSFSKQEKLTSKKKIEGLFKKGSSFYLGDFQVRHLRSAIPGPNQILISVPKRNFKRAVDRNLLKRKVREAYRLNKHLIDNVDDKSQHYIAFIYLSKQILTFDNIQTQLIKCLERLGSISAENAD
ncbi:ribonuclease P protein component [Ekhidna lutea]|uniref:Ribonuclease P protein component n=1 Tax=Ekhidna lutea TaxID=447679 RepID=A0A239IWM1_EKHLU|nr:ribonuclease P protein component [Ekhidna lutea]SNS96824.1 ribonuclease P protein component [Ekhidna lutea]